MQAVGWGSGFGVWRSEFGDRKEEGGLRGAEDGRVNGFANAVGTLLRQAFRLRPLGYDGQDGGQASGPT